MRTRYEKRVALKYMKRRKAERVMVTRMWRWNEEMKEAMRQKKVSVKRCTQIDLRQTRLHIRV